MRIPLPIGLPRREQSRWVLQQQQQQQRWMRKGTENWGLIVSPRTQSSAVVQHSQTMISPGYRRYLATGSGTPHGQAPPPLLDPAIAQYLAQQQLAVADAMTETQRNELFAKMVESFEAVYGKNNLKVSHLQSFGSAGLRDLAASILRQNEQTTVAAARASNGTGTAADGSNPVVTVRFTVPHHKTEFDLPWHFSTQPTLLDLAKSIEGAELLSEYLEGTCGGHASCCTCHVYIPTTSSEDEALQLSPVTESELDMLDLAYQPTDESRLACQMRLLNVTPSEGDHKPVLRVIIPSGVNNVWN